MSKSIVKNNLLFEITDIFGKKVRSTKDYWHKIKTDKHHELKYEHTDIIRTLENPDEVYRSVRDEHISLFYKQFTDSTLVAIVKYVNGNGFLVTAYQTTKVKRKGEKIWSK